MRKLIAVGLISALIAVTVTALISVRITGNAVPPTPTVTPDWTVALCTDWEGKTNEQMPAYTMTDRCIADDGAILYTPAYWESH